MKNKTLIAILLACSPTLALAHNITLGQSVPKVEVAKHGEIILQGDKAKYQAWSSDQLLGKVRVIQAIAGRSSAKKNERAAHGCDYCSRIPTGKLPNDLDHQPR